MRAFIAVVVMVMLGLFSCALLPDRCTAADGSSAFDAIEQMIDEGNYDRAESLLTDRLVTNDKDVVALTLLGELCRVKGNRKKAVDLLKKSIQLDAKYPESYFVLAKTYIGMQKYDDADAQFVLFREKMKGLAASDASLAAYYVTALNYMSVEYLGLKRYDDFRKIIDEIIRIRPQDQQAFYNLGIYYYQYKHDRASAYQSFDKAMKIDPTSAVGAKARYAIEFIRANPDSRLATDLSFINQEFKD
jgi:tetratricopeptide (TPR) repeat protein